jgi:signal transduction histidine kinase/FixJ family two-component response regulator
MHDLLLLRPKHSTAERLQEDWFFGQGTGSFLTRWRKRTKANPAVYLSGFCLFWLVWTLAYMQASHFHALPASALHTAPHIAFSAVVFGVILFPRHQWWLPTLLFTALFGLSLLSPEMQLYRGSNTGMVLGVGAYALNLSLGLLTAHLALRFAPRLANTIPRVSEDVAILGMVFVALPIVALSIHLSEWALAQFIPLSWPYGMAPMDGFDHGTGTLLQVLHRGVRGGIVTATLLVLFIRPPSASELRLFLLTLPFFGMGFMVYLTFGMRFPELQLAIVMLAYVVLLPLAVSATTIMLVIYPFSVWSGIFIRPWEGDDPARSLSEGLSSIVIALIAIQMIVHLQAAIHGRRRAIHMMRLEKMQNIAEVGRFAFSPANGIIRLDIVAQNLTGAQALAPLDDFLDRFDTESGIKLRDVLSNHCDVSQSLILHHPACPDSPASDIKLYLWEDVNQVEGAIFHGYVINVTTEQNLRAALAQAEKAAQAKSMFLATMSHEMRTPLHGLIASLDLIEEARLNDGNRALLKTARDCSMRALTQVDDVLELNRLGESRETPEILRPVSIAADIIEELGILASQSHNQMSLIANGPFDDHQFEGYPIAFARALYNLAVNAVKFTQGGRITIRLSLARTAPREFNLKVSVEDTGAGIAPADQQRIFANFETATRSEISANSGSGLGLPIVKLAVERQGGTIQLSSTLGVGSCFTFTVPVKVLQSSVGKLPANTPAAIAAPADLLKDVLVVDDNEINLTVMKAMVERIGHRVEVARNGQEAADMANLKGYDVILMDFSMPVMDGPTSARMIRLSGGPSAHSLIIGVTAMIEASGGAHVGMMDDVLIKPVSLQELDDTLRNTVTDPIRTQLIHEQQDTPSDQMTTIIAELTESVGAETALRFVEDTLSDVATALQAIRSKDMPPKDKSDIIHKAVGSTGVIGFLDLSDALSKAESIARSLRDPGLTDLGHTIAHLLDTAQNDLTHFRKQVL